MRNTAFVKKLILASAIILFLSSCGNKENATADDAAIRNIYTEYTSAVIAKNVNKIMSFYAPGDELLAFDAFIPRQYRGTASYQKDYEEFFKAFPGAATSRISDLNIKVSGNLAYATCIDQWSVTDSSKAVLDMIFRCTDVFEKQQGRWLIIHEHLSFPVDPATGKADYSSK